MHSISLLELVVIASTGESNAMRKAHIRTSHEHPCTQDMGRRIEHHSRGKLLLLESALTCGPLDGESAPLSVHAALGVLVEECHRPRVCAVRHEPARGPTPGSSGLSKRSSAACMQDHT